MSHAMTGKQLDGVTRAGVTDGAQLGWSEAARLGRAVNIAAASRKAVGCRVRANCNLKPAVTAVAPLARSPMLHLRSRNKLTSADLSASVTSRTCGSCT